MNAEILEILAEELSKPSPEEWLRRLDDACARYAGRTWDPSPEVLIREGRDSR